MMRIQIIIGSTRPGRNGTSAADWVFRTAHKRSDAFFSIVDIADYHLPLLDEPVPAMNAELYVNKHTIKWSTKIAEADAYIFVTPEYNASIPASLKNAIDFLYREWTNKPVAFVGYGIRGGAQAIQHLRDITDRLKMKNIKDSVQLSLQPILKTIHSSSPLRNMSISLKR